MRAIKFRAYDPIIEIMIEPSEVDEITIDFLTGSELQPMQFTGLLDKNGVEIYEGDLLRIKYEDDDLEEVLPVIWLCCGFLVNWPNGFGDYTDISELCDNYDVEVIGNIHENPELLEN